MNKRQKKKNNCKTTNEYSLNSKPNKENIITKSKYCVFK